MKTLLNINKLFLVSCLLTAGVSLSAMDNSPLQSVLPTDIKGIILEDLDYLSLMVLATTSHYWREVIIECPVQREFLELRKIIARKKEEFEAKQGEKAAVVLKEITSLGGWYQKSFIKAVTTGVLTIKQTDWESDESTVQRPSRSTRVTSSTRPGRSTRPSGSAVSAQPLKSVPGLSGRNMESLQLQKFLRLLIKNDIKIIEIEYSLNKKPSEIEQALIDKLIAKKPSTTVVTSSSSSSSSSSSTTSIPSPSFINAIERRFFIEALKAECNKLSQTSSSSSSSSSNTN